MGLFNKKTETTTVRMITETTGGFYSWNGRAYQSDIVRACIRPAALAGSKLEVKHIRETKDKPGIVVNPEPYMQLLLSEPNALMSMPKLLEKMFTQLKLNNNAFALIVRDPNGYPLQIIPIYCSSAEVLDGSELYLRFLMRDGKRYVFKYSDIIHLRRDYNASTLFGESNMGALQSLMGIITTTDQGIVAAIKNSSVIRWLLKFTTSTRPEDIEAAVNKFADSFLSINSGRGVAGVDTKADAIQIEPKEYVPNAAQMDKTVQRLYSLFGVNDKIVQNKATEDENNAYFEGDIEPIVVDLQEEMTRKLFSRRERAWGNRIVCDAGLINAASYNTKLSLVAMVDRGALTANEWRRTMNLPPIDGGDTPIRRLDTMPVTEEGGNE